VPVPAAALHAAAEFAGGGITLVEPLGDGLINDTFLVCTEAGRFVLQRINHKVFPDPSAVMANLRAVSDHLREHAAASGDGWRLPEIIRSRDGGDFHRDRDGGYWRALTFIDGAHGLAPPLTSEQAGQLGRALGRFHALAAGIDPARLLDTLPGFHIAPAYLARFDEVRMPALAVRDSAEPKPGKGLPSTARSLRGLALRFLRRNGGADSPALAEALAFVEARRHRVGVLEDARAAGRLRVRVIHGDPKLDNVLFCDESGRAVSLIDLDTVKPGLIHYDLGDCLRSCCNRAGESGPSTQAEFDADVCRAILRGYVAEARHILTAADFEYLYDAIRLLPFELGLRFLTDHLAGDVYFKVEHHGQNLERALLQFRLAESVERQEGEIRGIVAELATAES
jgi:Ser/Thr protein kinase RdoA (MazF antagonist)